MGKQKFEWTDYMGPQQTKVSAEPWNSPIIDHKH